MKEAIFHPEAQAEMRESVEFYEVQLDGVIRHRCLISQDCLLMALLVARILTGRTHPVFFRRGLS